MVFTGQPDYDDDDPDEQIAEGEPMETFTLTVPDRSAPRGKALRGTVLRTWELPPAAAGIFEDTLRRHAAKVRNPVRIYRGQRELLPDLHDDDDDGPTPTPAAAPWPSPTPSTPDLAAAQMHVRETQQHLSQLRATVELEQRRLGQLQDEIEQARKRRDEELRLHTALVNHAHSSSLTQITQVRDHATRELARSLELDVGVSDQMARIWGHIDTQAQTLGKIRGLLVDSVLADRLGGYLQIGQQMMAGLVESPLGRAVGLHVAARISAEINRQLEKMSDGNKGRPVVTPDDVMLATVLSSAAYAERRRLLHSFAAVDTGLVGQALLIGPAYCCGEADEGPVRGLIESAQAARTPAG